ncbi:phosphatidate phosphatase LPIN2 isoform X3 [Periplaneta americana]|uniref:phosphatidate phosphatase LPIN2 isoform X3 n=1 Tax=Periplaneta americana TaxID=6978 RepID=UPI0037E85C90
MYSMNYIGKFISNFRDFYNEINAATLTGAIDVVVVEQPDGSFTCSPFHVRFGKLGVLRSREKVVDIEINGEALDIHMKLGESGEAFFVEEVTPSELGDDEDIPSHLACSPIPDDDFISHFHGGGATVTEISNVDWHEQNVDVLDRPQQHKNNSRYEEPKPEDSSQENTAEQPVVVTSGASVPKTFCAETVNSDNNKSEKVRRISIVAADFRPISLIVEDDVPAMRNDEGLLVDDALDIQNASEENQEQSLVRKDSGKENSAPGNDDLLKPNSGGKRKRRRKSLMKKKGAGQRKNGVGSNTQPESNDGNGAGKSSAADDVPEQGIFQIEDLNTQTDDGSSSQEPCSHLGGIMINDTEGTVYSSAVDCESCSKTPMTMSLGTAMIASSVPGSDIGSPLDTDGELARIQHASTETDFHFFSDTEATPGCGRGIEVRRIPTALSDTTYEVLTTLGHFPHDSRPCSPVQSDTEFEMNRQSKAVDAAEEEGPGKSSLQGQSWRWGELPSPPPRPLLTSQSSRASLSKMEPVDPEPISSSDEEKQQEAAQAEAQRSMLSGMFSFMKKTKRIRHNPESEGIYLSDLNVDELDPEVAALYFPTSYRQGETTRLDTGETRDEEDAESGNGTSLPQSPHSVEGAIGGPKSLDSDFEEPKHSVFEKKSYGEISMSLCGGLGNTSSPTEDSFLQGLVTYNDLVQNPKLIENPDLVQIEDRFVSEYMPIEEKGQKKPTSQQESSGGGRGYSSWFYWRRTSEPKKISTNLSASDVSSPESEKLSEVKEVGTPESQDEGVSGLSESEKKDESPVKQVSIDIPMGETVLLDMQKEVKEEGYSGSNSSDESDGGRTKAQSMKLPIQRRSYYEHTEKYRKTLRLSSDQIASLNLNEGANEVVFSVTTAYQGTTKCKCHIYKWRFDDKVVISDIDGTITKSDVLGHILPIVGKDWAQSGVAQLFTKIKNNGYKLLYLSARAIGQARVTREYLRSIKQGDLSLPDGPLLLNPTSLISAFHREVIEKKPEEFKISCLRDIQALFPNNSKPFYAGYGNKINDVWAYRAVGIPIFRIFTINHRGELKHELTQTFQSSYSNMSYIVDQMFPPPPEDTSEDFSNFIYWRDPIPDLIVDAHLNAVEVSAAIVEDMRRKSMSASTAVV